MRAMMPGHTYRQNEAGGDHVTMERLIDIIREDRHEPHLDHCACCREEYDLLRAMETRIPGESSTAPFHTPPYRLAAQSSAEEDFSGFRARRTWYLEGNKTVLRVLEDESNTRLIGYLLREAASAPVFIRFDGIDGRFEPDADGRFEIGPSSLGIETMTPTLETP